MLWSHKNKITKQEQQYLLVKHFQQSSIPVCDHGKPMRQLPQSPPMLSNSSSFVSCFPSHQYTVVKCLLKCADKGINAIFSAVSATMGPQHTKNTKNSPKISDVAGTAPGVPQTVYCFTLYAVNGHLANFKWGLHIALPYKFLAMLAAGVETIVGENYMSRTLDMDLLGEISDYVQVEVARLVTCKGMNALPRAIVSGSHTANQLIAWTTDNATVHATSWRVAFAYEIMQLLGSALEVQFDDDNEKARRAYWELGACLKELLEMNEKNVLSQADKMMFMFACYHKLSGLMNYAVFDELGQSGDALIPFEKDAFEVLDLLIRKDLPRDD